MSPVRPQIRTDIVSRLSAELLSLTGRVHPSEFSVSPAMTSPTVHRSRRQINGRPAHVPR